MCWKYIPRVTRNLRTLGYRISTMDTNDLADTINVYYHNKSMHFYINNWDTTFISIFIFLHIGVIICHVTSKEVKPQGQYLGHTTGDYERRRVHLLPYYAMFVYPSSVFTEADLLASAPTDPWSCLYSYFVYLYTFWITYTSLFCTHHCYITVHSNTFTYNAAHSW